MLNVPGSLRGFSWQLAHFAFGTPSSGVWQTAQSVANSAWLSERGPLATAAALPRKASPSAKPAMTSTMAPPIAYSLPRPGARTYSEETGNRPPLKNPLPKRLSELKVRPRQK